MTFFLARMNEVYKSKRIDITCLQVYLDNQISDEGGTARMIRDAP